jgi:hypothetical protein
VFRNSMVETSSVFLEARVMPEFGWGTSAG